MRQEKTLEPLGRDDAIELPGVRVDRSIETWHIVEPAAKLEAKYTRGGSLIFDHYVFHLRITDPDRITLVDMAAVDALMNANISAKHVRTDRVQDPELIDRVRSLLVNIPPDARLEDATWDDAVTAAASEIVGPEIGVSIATKLLMVKRPWLVPMLDRVVRVPFEDPSDIRVALRRFRELLAHNADRIAALQRFVSRRFGLDISPVRVLDQLIWFDWNTLGADEQGIYRVRGFPEWGHDPKAHDRGVHRLAT